MVSCLAAKQAMAVGAITRHMIARKLGLTGGLPGVTAGLSGVRGRQLRWFKRDPGTR